MIFFFFDRVLLKSLTLQRDRNNALNLVHRLKEVFNVQTRQRQHHSRSQEGAQFEPATAPCRRPAGFMYNVSIVTREHMLRFPRLYMALPSLSRVCALPRCRG